MALKKGMKDHKEETQRLHPAPKRWRTQELLPVYAIGRDGVFQLEDKPPDVEKLYDKAYLFWDTNFATMDDEEKEDFLKLYCMTLNSLNVSFKIVVMNNNQNMEQVRQEVFIRTQEPGYQGLIKDFNKHIEACMLEGHAGIEQVRIFILTCKRTNENQARDYFRSVESNLAVNFDRLQSGLIPLNATERLRYLHCFYRMGEETRFQFDYDTAVKRRADWKDIIAPREVAEVPDEYGDYTGDTLRVNNRYVRAMYVAEMPNSINPEIIKKLTSVSENIIITVDVAAIPMEVVRKRLHDLYLQNGRAIEKQQEIRNRAMAFSSDITYERRREKEELESYQDIINENDEKMFYVGVYAVISASGRKELENAVVSFQSIAQGEGFTFTVSPYSQIDVMNTALPVGARFCSHMYPLFTQPLCAFTPFIVHELYEPGGIFYGVNQVSKNVLIGNRKKLKNGNGFILGVTGGGKGMDTKQELAQVYFTTDDDIMVIDPQDEYEPVARALRGEFVSFGAEADHYINPLSMDTMKYMDKKRTFLMDKTELMLGIFSQIMDHDIQAQEKSIVGRVVNKVYEGMENRKFKEPTLTDFYHELKKMPEEQAGALALALELFVSGSLDMFSRKTNINLHNRLTVFGIADLGKEQAGIGMLIMLESIRARVAENAKKGKATWLFIDEFHNLASQEYSARFLEKIWKEFRKLGGLCTAITQNIRDLMSSKVVETMLCNSEYLSLLNQSDIEIRILSEVLGISDNLLRYVDNVPPGCGLLKFGSKYIPKDNRLPKDSEMYRLFNTNFHEIQEQKKKKLKKEVKQLPELVECMVKERPTKTEQIYP